MFLLKVCNCNMKLRQFFDSPQVLNVACPVQKGKLDDFDPSQFFFAIHTPSFHGKKFPFVGFKLPVECSLTQTLMKLHMRRERCLSNYGIGSFKATRVDLERVCKKSGLSNNIYLHRWSAFLKAEIGWCQVFWHFFCHILIIIRGKTILVSLGSARFFYKSNSPALFLQSHGE